MIDYRRGGEPRDLQLNFGDADAGQRAAVTLGPAHALTALLLEHADLRPARLAVDDAQHFHVRHERRPGQHFAAVLVVLLDEQDAIDADFVPRLGVDAVDFDDVPRGDLHLAAAALND